MSLNFFFGLGNHNSLRLDWWLSFRTRLAWVPYRTLSLGWDLLLSLLAFLNHREPLLKSPPPQIISSLAWPPAACFLAVDDLEFQIILLPGTTDLCYQSLFIPCWVSNLVYQLSYVSQLQLCLLFYFLFVLVFETYLI